jgi:hypothetical protein
LFIPVHARELADVREGVLEAVRQLEGIDVAQPELQNFAQTSDSWRRVSPAKQSRVVKLAL